jgi:hypothetical protein
MANAGRLELEFVDVHGMRITEPLDIVLRHRILDDHRRVDNVDGTQLIAITDLRTEPQGLHILRVTAPSYRPVARFVTIPASGVARERVVLPIRHDRARAVFPSYDEVDQRVRGLLERSRTVRGHEGLTGRALYDSLSDVARAGLLNIAKKSHATARTCSLMSPCSTRSATGASYKSRARLSNRCRRSWTVTSSAASTVRCTRHRTG